jgi:hypothetical protein
MGSARCRILFNRESRTVVRSEQAVDVDRVMKSIQAVFCVQVRNCFLLTVMLMRVVSEKYKLMRVGLHTGILSLRAPMDGILF